MNSQDVIIRSTAEKAPVRYVLADLTNTMNEIGSKHEAQAWTLKLMAEAAVASSFISSSLKMPGTVSFYAEMAGDISFVTADTTPMGLVRAMIPYDQIMEMGDLELEVQPRLLKVKKFDQSAKLLSEGIVEMASAEIGKSLSVYLLQSEQTKSAVGIEARFNEQDPTKLDYAVGFMLEAFPDIDEKTTAISEQIIKNLPPMSSFFKAGEGYDLKGLLKQLAGPFPYTIHREIEPKPYCSCSRASSLAALKGMTLDEVKSLEQKEGKIEIICDLCRNKYYFTVEEAKSVL